MNQRVQAGLDEARQHFAEGEAYGSLSDAVDDVIEYSGLGPFTPTEAQALRDEAKRVKP